MSFNRFLVLAVGSLLIGAALFTTLTWVGATDWFSASAGFLVAALLLYARFVIVDRDGKATLQYRLAPGLPWLERKILTWQWWVLPIGLGYLAAVYANDGVPKTVDQWLLGGIALTMTITLLALHPLEERALRARYALIRGHLLAWATDGPEHLRAARKSWVEADAWVQGLSGNSTDYRLHEPQLNAVELAPLHWLDKPPARVAIAR